MISELKEAELSTFTIIRNRWDEHSDETIEKLIDKRFIPLIKRINEDPDMATMYCCSGHIKGERNGDSKFISSYMVIVARGDRINDLKNMVKQCHMLPARRANMAGWTYCVDTVALTPWNYPVNDFQSVDCLTIYAHTTQESDPTGEKIAWYWGEIFRKYIFKEKTLWPGCPIS